MKLDDVGSPRRGRAAQALKATGRALLRPHRLCQTVGPASSLRLPHVEVAQAGLVNYPISGLHFTIRPDAFGAVATMEYEKADRLMDFPKGLLPTVSGSRRVSLQAAPSSGSIASATILDRVRAM